MVHKKKTADMCCHYSLREKRENFVQGKRGDPLMEFISRNEWL